MTKFRSQRLDNLCETISEDRAVMNDRRTSEKASILAAMKYMREGHGGKAIGRYSHAGVELVFVPGEDKLRVRITKEPTDAASVLENASTTSPDPEPEADPASSGAGEVQGSQVPF